MSKLISTRPHSSPNLYDISRALSSCTHVFIRHGAIRRPLQPTYDGPFRILGRKEKVFIVKRNGNEDAGFIDHIKPAFLDAEKQPRNKLKEQLTPIP
ncbi:unnamed protein product [Mesocestoides corti]|uniref:Reverse transcriptase domain-containing protein n=1 Tax=Mesocestoides corti TaxID=53468 RepID=A0A0R3UH06_MESCO|nr:unnamed protein product [Mesocestoides corti]